MPELSTASRQPGGYEFGPYRVDVHGRTVYLGEARIPLTPKEVDLLVLLLRAGGEVVTRADMLQEVWPDVVVEEANIAKVVHHLRDKLEKTPEAIETVHKRGYRFLAPVREWHPPPDPMDATAPPSPFPEVDVRSTAEPARAVPARKRRIFIGVGVSLLGALAAAALIVSIRAPREPLPALDPKSITVLPFKIMGEEASEAYFGEGLAEDISTHLSKVPGLRVVSRASSLDLRSSPRPLKVIGAELAVGSVIEGSIRRSEGRTRISVQLTDVASGRHLWAETYDREARSVLDVQGDVATKVAGALAVRLTEEQGQNLRRGSTSNPEAYDLYLRGVAELDRWLTDDSLLSAIGHLERAVAVDPRYARAHAQLAWAYARAGLRPKMDPGWVEKTRASVQKALELEPSLALPHVAQSFLLWSWPGNWDADGAIKELRLAQELEPNVGHLELGVLYGHLGLEDAAARELAIALSYDPLSHWTKDRTIRAYDWITRWPDAWARAHAWFADPEATQIAFKSAMRVGHVDEVLGALAPMKDPFVPLRRALALAARGGPESEIRTLMTAFLATGGRKQTTDWHHFAYDLGCIEALLGHPDAAVGWLREAAEGGFPNYLILTRDPFLASLRAHPGFVKLLAELKPKWERWQGRYH